MASGWNLWVWLECIGVVSGCCCKEVYRYPHNNYYFSLLHLYFYRQLFFGSSIPTSLFIFKMFFLSCKKECQMTIFYFVCRALKLSYYGDIIHSIDCKSAVEHDGAV